MNLPERKRKTDAPPFPMGGNPREILKGKPGIQVDAERISAAWEADVLNGEQVRPLMILGGAGSGKTTERKELTAKLGNQGFSVIQCCANDRAEMEEFLLSTFVDAPRKLRVIFMDEIHKCRKGGQSPWEATKELWNGNGKPVVHTLSREVKTENGKATVPETFTYYPLETLWILSSNIETKDPALFRRCEEIVFRPLGPQGIRKMIQLKFREFRISWMIDCKATLDFLAGNVRPNGGAIETLAHKLRREARFIDPMEDGLTTCKALMVKAGIGIDGWTREHFAILAAAETAFLGGASRRPTLGDYGARALEGRGTDAAARMIEELIAVGFMITASGKAITTEGRGFLSFFRTWAEKEGFSLDNPNA